MAHTHKHSLFTEEGRTRLRNFILRTRSYLAVFSILGIISGVLLFSQWTYKGFGPLEKLYFRQYLKATVLTQVNSLLPFKRLENGKYVLLIATGRGGLTMVGDEEVYPALDEYGQYLRNQYGLVFRAHEGYRNPEWRMVRWSNAQISAGFESIYGDTYLGLFWPALLGCLLVSFGGTAGAVTIDHLINRKYEDGKLLRGTRLIDIKDYAKEVGGVPGLTLMVQSPDGEKGVGRLIRGLLGRPASPALYPLYIKKEQEAESLLITGDTGSGKSQLLHRLLVEMAERENESVIIYDPTCEFVRRHYCPERGDVILNPLDLRSPYWAPANEWRSPIDAALLANAFFPAESWAENKFFSKATNDFLRRLFSWKPRDEQARERDATPAELVAILANEKAVDALIGNGVEANYVKDDAPAQRAGVLGNLTRIASTLQLLMGAVGAKPFSFTHWMDMGPNGGKRRGWIFICSQKDTEETLRPLYVVYFDIIMRRLLSGDPEDGAAHPIKLILDEVQTLEHLPTLPRILTEGRKFGVCVAMAMQNPGQLRTYYGDEMAKTILAQPHMKWLGRCNEPDSARWMSRLVGEQENEKARTSVTASVSDQGRDSIHYGSEQQHRAVIMPEEIMALPNLSMLAVWEGLVTKFKVDILALPAIAPGFEARPSTLPERVAPRPSPKKKKVPTELSGNQMAEKVTASAGPRKGPGFQIPRWYNNGT